MTSRELQCSSLATGDAQAARAREVPLSFAFKRQCHLSEQSSLIAARSQVGLLSSVETCHPRKRKRVGGSKLPSTRISASLAGFEPATSGLGNQHSKSTELQGDFITDFCRCHWYRTSLSQLMKLTRPMTTASQSRVSESNRLGPLFRRLH